MASATVLERKKISIGSSYVKTASALYKEDILNLLNGQYLCLQVSNYYPEWLCENITNRLLDLPLFSRYSRAKSVGVKRTGLTFFETKGDAELLQKYYDEVKDVSTAIRNSCFPYLAPIDKLRLELEEIWPMGARLENIHGKTMMAGIVRMFEENFELPPHQDILARDVDGFISQTILHTQLSANIYLQSARHGGELQVWQAKPCQSEFMALTTDGLHLDPEKLAGAKVQIKPMQGDLILFDSGRVHSVQPSVEGTRVSMSCFIGYRGSDMPLTYWS